MILNNIKGLEKLNKNIKLSWEDSKKFNDLFENKIRGKGKTTEALVGEAYAKYHILLDINYIERIIKNNNFLMPSRKILDEWVTISEGRVEIRELVSIFKKYPQADIRRGEIWFVDLGQNTGSEQSGVRPCLVLQNNVGNKNSTTVLIAPIGTYKGRKPLPTQTIIRGSYTSGLNRDSVIMCEQLTTKDRIKFLSKLGELTEEEIVEVNTCWKIQLGDYNIIDKIKHEAASDKEGLVAKGLKKLEELYKKLTNDLSA